jgi:hypothetical protein
MGLNFVSSMVTNSPTIDTQSQVYTEHTQDTLRNISVQLGCAILTIHLPHPEPPP